MDMNLLEKIPKASEIKCVYFQFTFHGGYSLSVVGLDGYQVGFWKQDYSTTIYDNQIDNVLKYLLEHHHKLSEYSIFSKKYEKQGGELATY